MSLESAAELEQMLRDTGGVVVVLGGASTWGHLDNANAVVLDGEGAGVVADEPSVVVPTGALAGIAVDAAITVDGAPRVVRDHRREDDGALTRIFLAEA